MIDRNQIASLEKRLDKNSELEVSIDEIINQLDTFRKGFEPIEIVRPATIDDGIWKVKSEKFFTLHKEASLEGRFIKFVPASGAASRMFKKLESFNSKFEEISPTILDSEIKSGNGEAVYVKKFIDEIKNFAFFDSLEGTLKDNGFDLQELLDENKFKLVIDYAISEKGLNLSKMPKAVIEFHKNDDGAATPIEEHIAEATEYIADDEKNIKIHFTISAEHQTLFDKIIESVLPKLREDGFSLEITYSVQKKSTDTIAVDLDNNPFDDNGKLLFRPAGHGALLENLNDLNADIVYIKNIDNVLPKNLQGDTVEYKKLLGGVLVDLQKRCFEYLEKLESNLDKEGIDEITNFAMNDLNISLPSSFKALNIDAKKKYLFNKLNRPIRVCGMVKNEGEPGGGPFWVKENDGNISLQIVESSQINLDDPKQKEILEASTHFNPVDLVCGVKDYEGNNFDLLDYRDLSTGFITQKSQDGKSLKAMELPGLWNGAMAFWNTIFVEVPITTFAPVKEVNDLLKPQHQS